MIRNHRLIRAQKHATLAFGLLNRVPGLRPIRPDGAMYMMIGIDVAHFGAYDDDLEFVQALVHEQSVFCLPGRCFDYPNYMRIVLTVPEEMIVEACARIAEFCAQHYYRPAAALTECAGQEADVPSNGGGSPLNELTALNAVDC